MLQQTISCLLSKILKSVHHRMDGRTKHSVYFIKEGAGLEPASDGINARYLISNQIPHPSGYLPNSGYYCPDIVFRTMRFIVLNALIYCSEKQKENGGFEPQPVSRSNHFPGGARHHQRSFSVNKAAGTWTQNGRIKISCVPNYTTAPFVLDTSFCLTTRTVRHELHSKLMIPFLDDWNSGHSNRKQRKSKN